MKDYSKRIEPDLGNHLTIESQLLCSIAISLKRIADSIEKIQRDKQTGEAF